MSHGKHYRRHLLLFALALASGILSVVPLLAQDARELEQERAASRKLKGEHPLSELMRTRKSALRPELSGVHPRVYVTDEELAALRVRARTSHRELWQQALRHIRALTTNPPPPPAEERRAQNEVGIGIAEAALAYKIEGDKKYFDAARRYMDAAVSYDVWGYSFNKPNVDLAAGHLLYGLAWGYDLLYHDLGETERARYREKLAKQARLMYDYFKPKPGKTYAYSQNHTFIPISGLGVAAYALYDEDKDAPDWARLARAIFDRTLATYTPDGYYYEGFEYWIFSTPWLVHYMDAHLHATGEDLFDLPGLHHTHEYVLHSTLPSGQYVFDFGDIFEGPLTRAGRGEEYPRTHPGGHLHTNYNLLYRLASRFRSGEAQGVALWLKSLGQVNAEDYWSLLWYDPEVKPIPVERQPTSHYFPDHEVVYWRDGWTPGATAFAFKAGPPEGHHTAEQLRQFPDWRLSSGHAHPDANSFIIYARGHYLTGDSGYAGVPLTAHHNTVLVDGRGQGNEGKGHDAFDGFPYDQLNQVRITEAQLGADSAVVRGDATAAYDGGLGLTRFVRELKFTEGGGFTVTDDLQARRPVRFTSLLHADERIEKLDGENFTFDAGGVKLLVTPETGEAGVTTAIEDNDLTAPGPPGAVDKGERQVRGRRLAISTATPVTQASFRLRLKVEGGVQANRAHH